MAELANVRALRPQLFQIVDEVVEQGALAGFGVAFETRFRDSGGGIEQPLHALPFGPASARLETIR